MLRVLRSETKALVCLENLGAEIPAVGCAVIAEGLRMDQELTVPRTEQPPQLERCRRGRGGRLGFICSFT